MNPDYDNLYKLLLIGGKMIQQLKQKKKILILLL